MPYTGEVRTARGEQDNIEGAASSYYKHANEAVAPGYYSLLMDNGVKAELTATERVALHRYTCLLYTSIQFRNQHQTDRSSPTSNQG